jgi:hypothetical protein
MATINRTPPEPPRWQFSIDEDERQYLLTALDMAASLIVSVNENKPVSDKWPQTRGTYWRHFGRLEQVLASADPEHLQ